MISPTTAITAMVTIVMLSIGSMVSAIAGNDVAMLDPNPMSLPKNIYHLEDIIEPEHIYDAAESDWEYDDLEKEKQCLAENIYFEARGEDMQGQLAVALVTLNRVKDNNFPNSICSVVWQRSKSKVTGKWVAQFSWTLDGKPDIPHEGKAWDDSYRLADAMIAEGTLDAFADITNGSTHYHANYVNPNWHNLHPTVTFGNHIFYSTTPVALTQ